MSSHLVGRLVWRRRANRPLLAHKGNLPLFNAWLAQCRTVQSSGQRVALVIVPPSFWLNWATDAGSTGALVTGPSPSTTYSPRQRMKAAHRMGYSDRISYVLNWVQHPMFTLSAGPLPQTRSVAVMVLHNDGGPSNHSTSTVSVIYRSRMFGPHAYEPNYYRL